MCGGLDETGPHELGCLNTELFWERLGKGFVLGGMSLRVGFGVSEIHTGQASPSLCLTFQTNVSSQLLPAFLPAMLPTITATDLPL